MNIFPIGTIASASSSGTIDSISYSMFEPNVRASSQKKHSVLVTTFSDKTMLTRKKAEPFLVISYEYDNIFSREFRQIEHFVEEMDDALTSFYVVDWSKGQTSSSVTDASGDWLVAIDSTKLYSTIANQKAHKAFIWDGVNWKEGDVDTLVANTSITVDVDTDNYGNLSLTNANLTGIVYPLYTCYFTQNVLQNFKTTHFIHDTININKDGGFMYSGQVSFSSKHKV